MRLTSLIVCSIAITTFTPEPCATKTNKGIREDATLKTSDVAMVQAIRYSGFAALDSFDENNITADTVIYDGDNTPFISHKINNRMIWKVYFDDIQIDYWGVNSIQDFVFLLDPDNGYLLKIYSDTEMSTKAGADKLPASDIERIYLAKHTKYSDIFGNPGISFYEALQACPVSFIEAKKITAISVIEVLEKVNDTCAVWVIELESIPALVPIGGPPRINVPEERRDTLRCVINAKNGKVRYYDNCMLR